MPEMELKIASGCLSYMDIWYRVISYMIAPDDEERRRAYVARSFVDALAKAERFVPSLVQPLQKDMINLAGGYSALAASGFNDWQPHARRTRDWGTAGSILYLVRLLDAYGAEASVRKAKFMIREEGKTPDVRRSERQIMEAWQKYRNVSHLIAAYQALRGFEFGDKVWWRLSVLLAIARDLQRFGTGFIPAGTDASARGPLLDPQSVWSVPEDFPLPELDTSIFWRLNKHGIETQERYERRRS